MMEVTKMQEYLYYEHGDSSRGNLLTGYNGKTITSDTIGNMLSDGIQIDVWKLICELKVNVHPQKYPHEIHAVSCGYQVYNQASQLAPRH